MNFSEAIQAMRDGKSVTRAGWSENDGYLVLMPGMKTVWHVTITPAVNAGNKLFFLDDYLANDWQVSNGVNKPEVATELNEDAA